MCLLPDDSQIYISGFSNAGKIANGFNYVAIACDFMVMTISGNFSCNNINHATKIRTSLIFIR